MMEGGCTWVHEEQKIAVQDVNRLRRHLQSKLVLDGDLRDAFLIGLADELEDDGRLHRSLTPLVASAPHRGTCGESMTQPLVCAVRRQ